MPKPALVPRPLSCPIASLPESAMTGRPAMPSPVHRQHPRWRCGGSTVAPARDGIPAAPGAHRVPWNLLVEAVRDPQRADPLLARGANLLHGASDHIAPLPAKRLAAACFRTAEWR